MLGTANGKAERQGSLQHFARKAKVSDESGTDGIWGDSASRQETEVGGRCGETESVLYPHPVGATPERCSVGAGSLMSSQSLIDESLYRLRNLTI